MHYSVLWVAIHQKLRTTHLDLFFFSRSNFIYFYQRWPEFTSVTVTPRYLNAQPFHKNYLNLVFLGSSTRHSTSSLPSWQSWRPSHRDVSGMHSRGRRFHSWIVKILKANQNDVEICDAFSSVLKCHKLSKLSQGRLDKKGRKCKYMWHSRRSDALRNCHKMSQVCDNVSWSVTSKP